MKVTSILAVLLVALCSPARAQVPNAAPLQPVVEAEEEVYSCQPLDNGSGPLWCHGSTCLARIGDRLFASGVQKAPDAQPLNNCLWTLFQRDDSGWRLLQTATRRTREPSPLAAFSDGRLFLSVNPTLVENPAQYSGPARPEVLQFVAADAQAAPQTLRPVWKDDPPFTEHSYRSFAADADRGELIFMQNIGYTHSAWTFLDRDGRWSAQGELKWPWGAEYDTPQPIRVCYPNVAMVDRAVYFCGVSDIVEPYEQWRQYKKELTGREWDYDFRRLFFTWCDDIREGTFHEWIEIASRDKTCGWIMPGDLWVAPDGVVHLLWTERAIDPRLREKFFPDARQSHALNYAVVRQGKIIRRRTLLSAEEGGSNEIPGGGRFQITPEGRLFVVCHVGGSDANGRSISENRLMEIFLGEEGNTGNGDSGGNAGGGSWAKIPLSHPMSSYFTATVRAGSPPSRYLELLGQRVDQSNAIGYARVKIY